MSHINMLCMQRVILYYRLLATQKNLKDLHFFLVFFFHVFSFLSTCQCSLLCSSSIYVSVYSFLLCMLFNLCLLFCHLPSVVIPERLCLSACCKYTNDVAFSFFLRFIWLLLHAVSYCFGIVYPNLVQVFCYGVLGNECILVYSC